MAPSGNKMRENLFSSFGHVQDSSVGAPVRIDRIIVRGSVRTRGRPK